MKRYAVLMVLVTAAGGGAAGRQLESGSGDPEVALKAAITRELIDGDVNAAIARYRALADGYRTANPDLAARALLQLGASLDRIGSPEASRTYHAIVREYKDLPAARAARARLDAATALAQELTPRRVLDGGLVQLMDISADGRLVVGSQRSGYSRYDVVLRDATTGSTRTLASPGGVQVRVSSDGRRVAFNPSNVLRILDVENGATIDVPLPARTQVAPVDWSPDGSSVLVLLRTYGGSEDPDAMASRTLGWIDVATKATRPLMAFEDWQIDPTAFGAAVSPDGHWIAYTAQTRRGSNDSYLFVMGAGGGHSQPIVTTAGHRHTPRWTPDGTSLFFTVGDGGQQALWSIAMAGNQPLGEPQVVLQPFAGRPLRFTADGVFHYSRFVGGGNYEYLTSRAPAAGERPVTFPGLSGSWSRYGRIAFYRDGLIIREATGEERSIGVEGLTNAAPRWLPDDAGVIVVVSEAGGSHAFSRVDLDTGRVTRVMSRDDNGRIRTSTGALSPDGATIYLGTRENATAPVTGIVAVDLATGDERPVISIPAAAQGGDGIGLALNRAGTTLAVAAWTTEFAEARIFTVNVDGSDVREIVGSYRAGSLADTIRWTPDDETIVFVAHDQRRNWRLMRVPARGGPLEFDGLSYDVLATLVADRPTWPGNFNNIDLSPDGAQVLASTLTFTKHELWAIDRLQR